MRLTGGTIEGSEGQRGRLEATGAGRIGRRRTIFSSSSTFCFFSSGSAMPVVRVRMRVGEGEGDGGGEDDDNGDDGR